MRVRQSPPVHLTYCLNVHPGQSWGENLSAIRDKALVVRRQVEPGGRFGLGLRLSRQAADELSELPALAAFQDFLVQENLYVFTINGFPYGQFHGTSVKEQVYSPDWRSQDRLRYTLALAEVLAQLLPEDTPGSISTVPGSYKPWVKSPDDVRAMVENLCESAARLAAIRRQTGRDICLALEPEPDCLIETTAEAVEFFAGPLAQLGTRYLRRHHGLSRDAGEETIRRHLGICLDTAHAAVEFEDPATALRQLDAAGVRVGKVQLSSALRVRPTARTLARLKEFCEPVYLHQVKVRLLDGTIASYPDLPAALESATRPSADGATGAHASGGAGSASAPGSNAPVAGARAEEEWRIHFHVPLFFTEDDGLQSTSGLLTGDFAQLLRQGACPNLEIETYTFDVLPDFLRRTDVTHCIAREYQWVLTRLLA